VLNVDHYVSQGQYPSEVHITSLYMAFDPINCIIQQQQRRINPSARALVLSSAHSLARSPSARALVISISLSFRWLPTRTFSYNTYTVIKYVRYSCVTAASHLIHNHLIHSISRIGWIESLVAEVISRSNLYVRIWFWCSLSYYILDQPLRTLSIICADSNRNEMK